MRSVDLKKIKSLLIVFLLTISLYFTFFIAASDTVLAAQSEESMTAKLVEGAKKEGEVAFYCTMSIEDAMVLVANFHEKYPFIKMDLYRGDNAGVLNRVLMENRMKRRVNDVISTAEITTQAIKDNGLLSKYLSPESKFYPEGFKDKDGYWTDSFLSVHTVVYNTRLVPPKELPLQYKDLLNPKWKGKIGINFYNNMWILAIMDSMGEQKGLEFLKALAQQKPVVRSGNSLNVLLVAAGEPSMAVSINADSVERIKAKGAPVDWIRLSEPFYAELHPVALNAFAPHPNAAKLLIDYILSPEGQEVLLKLRRISSRAGLRPSYIKAEILRPLHPTPGNTEYTKKMMRQIFVK